MKIPKGTIAKIRERQLDMGQIIYDMVEQGLTPYGKDLPNDIGLALLTKLVRLMVENDVKAPEDYFTVTEETALRKILTEEL